MSISLIQGNIFNSCASVLVNPTNCIGPMGAGLAKQFKEKFPGLAENYWNYCRKGMIKPGILHLYTINSDLRVLNFPTKNHWKDPSKMEYVELGLNKFIDSYNNKNIKSVAFPLLGAGLGGLDKNLIQNYMIERLNPLEGIDIEIYV